VSASHSARGDQARRLLRTAAVLVGLLVTLFTSHAHAAGPALTADWRVESATELALTVTVEKGWHLNANDPDRPYLIPTTLEIDPPAGTTIVSIRYPDPVVQTLAFAPEMALRLYEGTFTVVVRVAGSVPARFDAKLAYQACNDETCLPPRSLPVPFESPGKGGAK
jgi:DsbC/DsbD-like thiol-disulfide interchange protein